MTYENLSKIWTEKYRPNTLDELCVSGEIRDTILNFKKAIPNLLFCGLPGTGKTTLAKIIVNDILKCDYLYINASDENGIDTIRNKVTGFAQTKSLNGELKVIILDEADFLSTSAQSALRNLMESYTDNTRFILTGNYKYKIIPALQSRCQSLEISPELKNSVYMCISILKSEKIEIPEKSKTDLVLLIKKYYPDLRKTINELQKLSINGVLNLKNQNKDDEVLNKIISDIKQSKTLELRKFLIENDNLFNYDWDQLLIDLLNHTYNIDMDDLTKKTMMIIIADHIEKSSRIIDKEINFFSCVLNLENNLK